ncbi:hypothetical protein LMG33818_000657 [Halomonadaceae bacterium LMG 33818]|uniref:hypothetical protein n=1 Tax=Cernens ardua TaxID=3402176 RepID=UPI003EDC24A2
MPRESSLSIKDKWALEAQLGEMLRGLDTTASLKKDEGFKKRLDILINEYGLERQDVVDILLCIQKFASDTMLSV